MQTGRAFFQISLKKDSHFAIKTFQILKFSTALLSFACDRHINKCKYLTFLKLKISANEKKIFQILLKIERGAILRSMDTQASNFQVRLHFYGSFQKLVLYC